MEKSTIAPVYLNYAARGAVYASLLIPLLERFFVCFYSFSCLGGFGDSRDCTTDAPNLSRLGQNGLPQLRRLPCKLGGTWLRDACNQGATAHFLLKTPGFCPGEAWLFAPPAQGPANHHGRRCNWGVHLETDSGRFPCETTRRSRNCRDCKWGCPLGDRFGAPFLL